MDQQLLTQVMKWKMEMFRSFTEKLPPHLKTTVREAEAIVLRSLQEANEQHMKEGSATDQDAGLKSVQVD